MFMIISKSIFPAHLRDKDLHDCLFRWWHGNRARLPTSLLSLSLTCLFPLCLQLITLLSLTVNQRGVLFGLIGTEHSQFQLHTHLSHLDGMVHSGKDGTSSLKGEKLFAKTLSLLKLIVIIQGGCDRFARGKTHYDNTPFYIILIPIAS